MKTLIGFLAQPTVYPDFSFRVSEVPLQVKVPGASKFNSARIDVGITRARADIEIKAKLTFARNSRDPLAAVPFGVAGSDGGCQISSAAAIVIICFMPSLYAHPVTPVNQSLGD